jgi:hypothetical protein
MSPLIRQWHPNLGPGLWLLLWIPLLLLGCDSWKAMNAPRYLPRWQNQNMLLVDSSSDSLQQRFLKAAGLNSSLNAPNAQQFWQQNQDKASPWLRIWQFESAWQAQLSWQGILGERLAPGNLVFRQGCYWLTVERALLQIGRGGNQLLSFGEVTSDFALANTSLGQEPGFSKLFLQKRRLSNSGLVLGPQFLGLSWLGPVYGMRYLWYGDTVQVVVAGPQDSLFYTLQRAPGHCKPNLGHEMSGYEESETSCHAMAFWRWGSLGVVGLEGCSATVPCSTWVEQQYQALEVFGRDGYFRQKSEVSN